MNVGARVAFESTPGVWVSGEIVALGASSYVVRSDDGEVANVSVGDAMSGRIVEGEIPRDRFVAYTTFAGCDYSKKPTARTPHWCDWHERASSLPCPECARGQFL